MEILPAPWKACRRDEQKPRSPCFLPLLYRVQNGTVPVAIRPRQCPCSTGCSTPSRHSVRQQQLDVSMSSCSLSPGRTRGGTLVAGGWGCRSDRGSLACLAPFRAPRLGVRVCSCSEFSEMLVSYLGVDSPAASSPGVLGASFSAYSGGRLGASGSSSMPEVGRSSVCRCPGRVALHS